MDQTRVDIIAEHSSAGPGSQLNKNFEDTVLGLAQSAHIQVASTVDSDSSDTEEKRHHQKVPIVRTVVPLVGVADSYSHLPGNSNLMLQTPAVLTNPPTAITCTVVSLFNS